MEGQCQFCSEVCQLQLNALFGALSVTNSDGELK